MVILEILLIILITQETVVLCFFLMDKLWMGTCIIFLWAMMTLTLTCAQWGAALAHMCIERAIIGSLDILWAGIHTGSCPSWQMCRELRNCFLPPHGMLFKMSFFVFVIWHNSFFISCMVFMLYLFIGLLSKKIENVQERHVSKQYWSHYFCNSTGDESGAEITHFTFE